MNDTDALRNRAATNKSGIRKRTSPYGTQTFWQGNIVQVLSIEKSFRRERVTWKSAMAHINAGKTTVFYTVGQDRNVIQAQQAINNHRIYFVPVITQQCTDRLSSVRGD